MKIKSIRTATQKKTIFENFIFHPQIKVYKMTEVLGGASFPVIALEVFPVALVALLIPPASSDHCPVRMH